MWLFIHAGLDLISVSKKGLCSSLMQLTVFTTPNFVTNCQIIPTLKMDLFGFLFFKLNLHFYENIFISYGGIIWKNIHTWRFLMLLTLLAMPLCFDENQIVPNFELDHFSDLKCACQVWWDYLYQLRSYCLENMPILTFVGTCNISVVHDDVIKWKHFPRNWPFVREIHRSPVNFPHKGQWRGALMFSLIYAWINDWVNNREAGDLRRQHGHYDVIVMAQSRNDLCDHSHFQAGWVIDKKNVSLAFLPAAYQ